MFARRAVAVTSLAAALLSPAFAATANAAPLQTADRSTSSNALEASWHFWGSNWTLAACINDGEATGRSYKCVHAKGTDHKWKYHLYVWY
ncbi:hypothetical protein AB0C21_14500 [Spirillospora sp. NPDC049024]